MSRRKSVVEYTVVEDPSKSPSEQQGYALVIEGRGGDTEKNRARALEVALTKYENGEIPADRFKNGLGAENILYVPPPKGKDEEEEEEETLLPIQLGAREAIEKTKLALATHQAVQEVLPYLPLLKLVSDYDNRPRKLTSEEMNTASDKGYGKAIEKFGAAVAEEQQFHANSTGNDKLIIAILEEYQNHLDEESS